MSLFQKLNGFNNPITAGRRACGTCIMIIGLIMCVPSIIGFFAASSIYNRSEVFDQSQTITILNVGGNITITANGIFNAGNDYDINLHITAEGPHSDAETGSIVTSVSCSDLSISVVLSRTSFNYTASDSDKTEQTTVRTTTIASVEFYFEITGITDVTVLTCRVSINENPNRSLVNLTDPNICAAMSTVAG